MKSKDAGFILSLVLGAAVLAVVAFMFVIRPALNTTSEAREQEEASRSLNDTLMIQIAAYKADFEKLPDTKAQIEEIQGDIHPREDVASVRLQITEILAAEGVRLERDNVSLPMLMSPGSLYLGGAAAAVGRESYVDELQFKDLYVTSFDLEFSGDLNQIVRTIARLQMNEDRYFLVSVFEARSEDQVPGGYVAHVKVDVFTLIDPALTVDPGINAGNLDEDGQPARQPELGDPLGFGPVTS